MNGLHGITMTGNQNAICSLLALIMWKQNSKISNTKTFVSHMLNHRQVHLHIHGVGFSLKMRRRRQNITYFCREILSVITSPSNQETQQECLLSQKSRRRRHTRAVLKCSSTLFLFSKAGKEVAKY